MQDGEWVVDGKAGQQIWIARGGRFTEVRQGEGTEIRLEQNDIDFLEPRRCVNRDCDENFQFLPRTFLYCTKCGKPTQPLLPEGITPWPNALSSRRGFPDVPGEPPPATAVADRQHLPRAFDKPGVGDFNFAVAGRPAHLIALDRTTRKVWLWSVSRQCWKDDLNLRISNLPILPPWSFGWIADETGLTVPVKRGLVKLELLPDRPGRLVNVPLDADVVAAPAVFAGGCALPVQLGSGLAVRLENPPEGLPVAGTGPLGQPNYNSAGDVLWPGESGFLVLQDGPPRAEWRSWPAGFTAMPMLRPYLDDHGVHWQIGRRSNGDFAFAAMTEENHLHWPARGLAICCGSAGYLGNQFVRPPWGPANDQRRLLLDGDDRFGLPLLLFGGNDGGLLYADLADYGYSAIDFLTLSGGKPIEARLKYKAPTGGELTILHEFIASSPDDIGICLYGDEVLLYRRMENHLSAWRYRGIGSTVA